MTEVIVILLYITIYGFILSGLSYVSWRVVSEEGAD